MNVTSPEKNTKVLYSCLYPCTTYTNFTHHSFGSLSSLVLPPSAHTSSSENERLVHMMRSHQARKHRYARDRTDEGQFDTPAARKLGARRPTKLSTVKMGLDRDGKASVYVVSANGASSSDTNGDYKRQTRSLDEPNAPQSTQKARWRSLKDYEAKDPLEGVPSQKLTARKSIGSLTMTEMLAMAHEETELEKDMAKHVQGVAIMLEHVKMDNTMMFLRTIKEYDIDLRSIHARNLSGSTALHVAAANNAMSLLEYLVTVVCVNINAVDNWNRTALDEAMRSGHEDVVRYLRAAGGHHGSNIDWNGGEQGDVAGASPPTSPNVLSRRGVDSDLFNYSTDSPAHVNAAAAALTCVDMRKGSMVEFENGDDSFSDINKPSVLPLEIDNPDDTAEANVTPITDQGVYFLPDGTAEWELLNIDVQVLDVIGEGAFGEIRSGKWRGCAVAIKTLKSDCMTDELAVKEFNCEMSIWCRLVHPNIVQFLGVGYKLGMSPIMVCEYMAGGSLQQKLHALQALGKKLDFDKAFSIGSNIASALHYMHSRRPFAVIHRDLKPANILLSPNGTAKVADFGLSKMFDISTPRRPAGMEGHESPSQSLMGWGNGSHSPSRDESVSARYIEEVYSQLYSHTFLMTGETGAYKYMAPEVFRHEFYGLKADVYSFAIVMYEVFEGLMALGDPIAWAHRAAGKVQLRPAWIFMEAYDSRRCQEMTDLVEQCWHADPRERPTFMTIIKAMNTIGRISKHQKRVVDATEGGTNGNQPGCACTVM